jgi:hypothetical protein
MIVVRLKHKTCTWTKVPTLGVITFTVPFSVCPEPSVSLLEVSSSPERAASPDKLLG